MGTCTKFAGALVQPADALMSSIPCVIETGANYTPSKDCTFNVVRTSSGPKLEASAFLEDRAKGYLPPGIIRDDISANEQLSTPRNIPNHTFLKLPKRDLR